MADIARTVDVAAPDTARFTPFHTHVPRNNNNNKTRICTRVHAQPFRALEISAKWQDSGERTCNHYSCTLYTRDHCPTTKPTLVASATRRIKYIIILGQKQVAEMYDHYNVNNVLIIITINNDSMYCTRVSSSVMWVGIHCGERGQGRTRHRFARGRKRTVSSHR